MTKYSIGHPQTTPGHVQLRSIGNTSSQWPGAKSYYGALRPFGLQVNDRLAGVGLPTVQPGEALGATYFKGMKHAYEFVKNP